MVVCTNYACRVVNFVQIFSLKKNVDDDAENENEACSEKDVLYEIQSGWPTDTNGLVYLTTCNVGTSESQKRHAAKIEK